MPKTLDLPLIIRSAQLAVPEGGSEARVADVVWSTGSRRTVNRWFEDPYEEELALTDNSVRLERLNAGAPLLNSHRAYDLEDVIGVIVEGNDVLACAYRLVAHFGWHTLIYNHLTARVPRTKLSALHVPAAYLGLPAGEDPLLELNMGLAFEPDGRVRSEGKGMVGGLAIAGNRARTPLEVDFSLVGDAGKPVEISRGVATYGPITADFGGRFTRDPVRGELRFTTKALPCSGFVSAEARKSLGAVGGLAADLFQQVVPVTGAVNIKGTFSFEPLMLESAKVKFDVRDTCGIALFKP